MMKYRALLLAIPLAAVAMAANAGSEAKSDEQLLSRERLSNAVSIVVRSANSKSRNIAVSVVDGGGNLLYFTRENNLAYGMGEAATKKARTAAAYGFNTKDLEDTVQQGSSSYLALPGILPLRGGVPIIVGGKILGGIGIAGSASDEDADFAKEMLAELLR